ncbi:MAG TPA: DUF1002 domain-containing protein [Candidatus Atribacteria bacterium]|nr:DUF1002 domain-containing protein [Candidatus Atribacteria bacterium]
MKRILSVIFSFLFAMGAVSTVLADSRDVVSLGADLTESQKQGMLDLFGVDETQAEIIEVTNEEERQYLEGLASEEKIGNKAISSAYVRILEEGRGIEVETHNISWVTKEMYANAMVTAGVENARVVVAAPFKVSGTAALTGIMKAFEKATGEKLTKEAKDAASEELVTSGELGEEIGKDKAAALIKKIKERIIGERITDKEDIRRLIIEIAADLDINLSQENLNKLADLMEKIGKLDLDVNKLTDQLEKISGHLDNIRRVVNENKGLLQRIIEAIQSFFRWLASLIRG